MENKLTRREFLVAAGATAVVAGAGKIIYDTRTTQLQDQEKLQQLRDELETIKEQNSINIVGDCTNENILRQAMGAEQISLDKCVEERQGWLDQIKGRLGLQG